MSAQSSLNREVLVSSMEELARFSDYSYIQKLLPDPDSTKDGNDYYPRQVFSGHYVPVKPTPLSNPVLVAYSDTLFSELRLDKSLVNEKTFKELFSGNLSSLSQPFYQVGWATGYALSIYGTEYIQQCPFYTGNGYGDGRAISVLEITLNEKHWEFQLKGGGRTPYCRGADGRAVLRSSVREFLAQEHMHALGVPTSRSLCLFTSANETVKRPWYSDNASDPDPDILVDNPVAITTRVAPSFIRVGQLELFARRARSYQHDNALKELEMLVLHLIEREYKNEIPTELCLHEKLLCLAQAFGDRLTTLIANWLRVGYCQGNFNSDNCAAGGFTLDYGPFGFCEQFDPFFQPWTGGGRHFSFLNQTAAAEANYTMFCQSLKPLLASSDKALSELTAILENFPNLMKLKLESMWQVKLGLESYDGELLSQLFQLMVKTSVDYTIFFRELSLIPDSLSYLEKSFYKQPTEELHRQWINWFSTWKGMLGDNKDEISAKMLQVNPKYTWREWLVVPAYENAQTGDYASIHELQSNLTKPYQEQTASEEEKYYRLKPQTFFGKGGVSHYSCSS